MTYQQRRLLDFRRLRDERPVPVRRTLQPLILRRRQHGRDATFTMSEHRHFIGTEGVMATLGEELGDGCGVGELIEHEFRVCDARGEVVPEYGDRLGGVGVVDCAAIGIRDDVRVAGTVDCYDHESFAGDAGGQDTIIQARNRVPRLEEQNGPLLSTRARDSAALRADGQFSILEQGREVVGYVEDFLQVRALVFGGFGRHVRSGDRGGAFCWLEDG